MSTTNEMVMLVFPPGTITPPVEIKEKQHTSCKQYFN